MQEDVITRGRQFVVSYALSLPILRFYKDNYLYIGIAKRLAISSSIVEYCAGCMRKKGMALGHSYYHAKKVAIESAAIVLKEKGVSSESIHLANLTLIAGFLHDYYREKKDHPARAAEYVQSQLSHIIRPYDVHAVSFAIMNHEAFKEYQRVEDSNLMLISNALYDADKFRWGPDNFLYTIWDMMASIHIPLKDMVQNFQSGMEYINSIRHTFRTVTGKQYGPEFIEQGMMIAQKLLEFLNHFPATK